MKKIALSLLVCSLCVSGDCFAAVNSFDKDSKQHNNAALQQVKGAWGKVKSNTKKVLGNRKVQVAAIGTAAIAAYHFVPGASDLVKSKAIGAVKNSKIGNVVKSWLDVANLKAKDTIKSWLGIEPVKKESAFKSGFFLGKTIGTNMIAVTLVPSLIYSTVREIVRFGQLYLTFRSRGII